MSKKTIHPNLESTLKSLDTEEPIDLYFYRPIGYCWALLFRKLGVSPNAVTIASIFIGVAAGICYYFTDLWINVLGILLLVWANTYDSADGQLARMTGQKSRIGRMLDGLCGDIWFIAIYAAICLRLTPEWGLWIWILAAVTGYFHSKQASMADYYRNIHLLFLKGKAGSELSYSPTLIDNYNQLTWKNDFVFKLFELFYIRYTEGQEKWSPDFQRLMQVIRVKYDGNAPESFRSDFRVKSLPLMKYTNMLSFNLRIIALFVSLIIGIPWLYFAFEMTVLNAILYYMVSRHERISAAFYNQLTD